MDLIILEPHPNKAPAGYELYVSISLSIYIPYLNGIGASTEVWCLHGFLVHFQGRSWWAHTFLLCIQNEMGLWNTHRALNRVWVSLRLRDMGCTSSGLAEGKDSEWQSPQGLLPPPPFCPFMWLIVWFLQTWKCRNLYREARNSFVYMIPLNRSEDLHFCFWRNPTRSKERSFYRLSLGNNNGFIPGNSVDADFLSLESICRWCLWSEALFLGRVRYYACRLRSKSHCSQWADSWVSIDKIEA